MGQIDLGTGALKADLNEAQRAIGVKLVTSEEKVLAGNGLRPQTERTHRVTFGEAKAKVRARFVKQGWSERAKKVFVKEVEIGEKAFDDAVYIATDTPDAVRELLKHERAREALVALVKKGAIIDASETELVTKIEDAYPTDGDEAAETLALAACLIR